jgi:hypothetical protein
MAVISLGEGWPDARWGRGLGRFAEFKAIPNGEAPLCRVFLAKESWRPRHVVTARRPREMLDLLQEGIQGDQGLSTRAEPGSFTIDDAMVQMSDAASGAGH